MTQYAFRIRFHLAQDDVINFDGKEVSLAPLVGSSYTTLRATDTDDLKTAHKLAVRAGGFGSFAESEERGEQVLKALAIAGANLGFGLDIGRYALAGGLTEAGRKHFGQQLHAPVRTDKHGLDVFEDHPALRFVGMSAALSVGKQGKKFEETLSAACEPATHMSDKTRLAYELYGLTHFEASQRARFVALATVVETLSDQQDSSEAVRDFVDGVLKRLASDLTPDDAEDIRDRLRFLKKESISRACRNLVRERLGPDEEKRFKSFYGIRSTLVHDGEVPGADFGNLAFEFDEQVKSLLTAVLGTEQHDKVA